MRSAAQYLRERKGWGNDDFRLELKEATPSGEAVLWAIFLEDERHPVPGGGESVELHVDREAGRVTRELGFQ